MATDLTASPFGGGFQRRSGSTTAYLKHTTALGWRDQNELLVPPERRFILGSLEPILGSWHRDENGRNRFERKPAESWDVEEEREANAAVPQSDWAINPNTNNPEPPFRLYCSALLLDELSGAAYRFEKAGYGARMLGKEIEAAAANTQDLWHEFLIVTLGEIVRKLPPPINNLKCPYFITVGRTDRNRKKPVVDGPSPTPQLSGPAEATPPVPAPPVKAGPAEDPITSGPQPKPKVQFAAPEPQPTGEVSDELPY